MNIIRKKNLRLCKGREVPLGFLGELELREGTVLEIKICFSSNP